MKIMIRGAVGVLVGILIATGATAQTPAASLTDFRADALEQMDIRAQKYLALAEAIPADRYTYSPADGVRSVAEVFLHVAVVNYGIPGAIGAAMPAGIDLGKLEGSTSDKAQVIEALRGSFEHQRAAVLELDPADATRTFTWFDQTPITAPGVLDYINGHLGEHLGQLIVYARVIGVKPPWAG